jgi:endonuclease YncB( thermonuclease family)
MLITTLLTVVLSVPTPESSVRVKASVQECHDGDTCRIDITETATSVFGIDMTFVHHEVARMCDINAPEVTGSSKVLGEESKRVLEKWIKAAKVVEVELPLKDGKAMREKYGRLLVWLVLDGVRANERMIREGYALPYFQCSK